jgi:tetratricopeptide (TPR) repeat protein
MVKNEESVICKTLQPFIDAGIDSYLVFDTGSTDNTVKVTQDFFRTYSVEHGIVLQEPFIDFSTSRNRALDLAENGFPAATFMLMLDAEWYMHNVQNLLVFCSEHQNDQCPAYLIRLMGHNLDFYTSRLIRCTAHPRFSGPVHEVLDYVTREKVPASIFFEFSPSRQGQEKTQQRWLRDCDLLLKENKQNPQSPRTVFYLAQTYDCLGDLENARLWYEQRTTMKGWDEENFMTYYRLAQVYERLGNWEKALCHYFNAIALRPQRAEPYIRLAQYYWDHNNSALCYFFARRASELPYPNNDILFVDKDFYLFTRYDLLGRSAWYVADYVLGEQAVFQALSVCPDKVYLQENLAWYTKKKHE